MRELQEYYKMREPLLYVKHFMHSDHCMNCLSTGIPCPFAKTTALTVFFTLSNYGSSSVNQKYPNIPIP